MELGIVNGLGIISLIKQKYTDIKVIGISVCEDPLFYCESEKINIDGYIHRSATSSKLIEAINKILDGGKYFPEWTTIHKPNNLKSRKINQFKRETFYEIIFLLCMDKCSKEIASILSISIRTVEDYRYEMNKQFNCHSVVEIVKYGMGLHIIDNPFLKKKFRKYINPEKSYPKLFLNSW